MAVAATRREPAPTLLALLVSGALLALAAAVIIGSAVPVAVTGVIAAATISLVRTAYISWPRLLAALVIVILFIPIRRYALPGNLPFQIEPYRVLVALILVGWGASLLVDRRTALRRTGFEGPITLIVFASFASIAANPERVTTVSSVVEKDLMFFLSYILIVYVTASVARRLGDVDLLVKTLVGGGAVVAALAIVEARTGVNVFNHLHRIIPILEPSDLATPEMKRFGAARLRVFGSAQHPIALSAAFVMLTPLALYLALRFKQRRWWLAATLLVAGCASTVSRTGIVMFVVVALVFLWLRPREVRRLWPALIPALIVIKLVLPGTLGAIKQSFLPAGGLVAEQQSMPGASGSGRLADIGPALEEWKQKPLFGVGFGTRIVDGSSPGPRANILDNQWLSSLLEVGALGFFAWLWFFARVIRRLGKEAKEDPSERGWLLASIAASIAAFSVGMLTFDAFSFIQVTFLMFILVGIGGALLGGRRSTSVLKVLPDRNWAR